VIEFSQADFSKDSQHIRELSVEYIEWVNNNLTQKLGAGFDIQAKVDEDMSRLQMFSPPDGCLLLVFVDSAVAGMGGLRTIGEQIGEIKRMYIRPRFRGQGLGRKVLSNLVERSITMGHTVLRLDSAWFMETAHAMYRSFGFKGIDPYPESEVPNEIRHLWLFMEKDLLHKPDKLNI
jgi:GNAT superfamily N-acetyltransferase